MRRLKAKEMYMCRVICLDPPSLGRLAGRSDRPNSAALRHNFSEQQRTRQKKKTLQRHTHLRVLSPVRSIGTFGGSAPFVTNLPCHLSGL